mgnify:CR=1 FL=1
MGANTIPTDRLPGVLYFDGSRLYPVAAATTTAISALPRSSPAGAGEARTYGCRALPVSGIAADPGFASSRLQSSFLTQLIFHVYIQLLNTNAVRLPGQTVLRRPLFSLPRLFLSCRFKRFLIRPAPNRSSVAYWMVLRFVYVYIWWQHNGKNCLSAAYQGR